MRSGDGYSSPQSWTQTRRSAHLFAAAVADILLFCVRATAGLERPPVAILYLSTTAVLSSVGTFRVQPRRLVSPQRVECVFQSFLLVDRSYLPEEFSAAGENSFFCFHDPVRDHASIGFKDGRSI
jgi:hypothetical protein